HRRDAERGGELTTEQLHFLRALGNIDRRARPKAYALEYRAVVVACLIVFDTTLHKTIHATRQAATGDVLQLENVQSAAKRHAEVPSQLLVGGYGCLESEPLYRAPLWSMRLRGPHPRRDWIVARLPAASMMPFVDRKPLREPVDRTPCYCAASLACS